MSVTTTRADRRSRLLGAAVGIAIAVAIVLAARVPAGTGELGLDLTVTASPSGELAIEPVGVVVTATALTPRSAPATGSFSVRNQTGRRMPFRVRALPSSHAADRALAIRVGTGRETVFEGRLAALRRWSSRALVLAPRERRTVTVLAWVPRDAAEGSRGQIVDVVLELSAREARPL